MTIIKLALRNIIGAGLRTWLNVFVLSLSFVLIIWTQGLVDGMGKQIMNNMIDAELGGGQYWFSSYDPYDPLTLEDAHGIVPEELSGLIKKGMAEPVLVISGSIFPDGRSTNAMLKGIDPDQKVIDLPAHLLKNTVEKGTIPALIGARMARQTGLKKGDWVTARWRDINGTFDATDLMIVEIMSTNTPSIDVGQIWLPLADLQKLFGGQNEATLITLGKGVTPIAITDENWILRDHDYLLADIRALIKSKSAGSAILYLMLLGMALLVIFDTQVLAVFRRRKEMGTLMALGMPRGSIIRLFTLEGAMNGFLALLMGAVYGIPLLALTAAKGIGVPEASSSMGFAMSSRMYPSYGIKLLLGTTLILLITVTFVSFLPTRKIVKLKPTDALRGKMS